MGLEVPKIPKEPELKCPEIGIQFPGMPDLEKLGEIKDDALEKVDALAERIKNPPPAKDLMKEFSNKVTSEADKLLKAANTAATQLLDDAEKQAAQAWEDFKEAANSAVLAAEAAAQGVVDDVTAIGEGIVELGENTFVGFKNANSLILI